MTSHNEEASADDENRIVMLKSKDSDVYELTLKAAKISKLVQTTVECDADDDDYDEDAEIEIPKVGSNCLAKVIEFCNHHVLDPMDPISTPLQGNSLKEIVTKAWYRTFIEGIDQAMVFELVTAANFMEIQPLLDLACLRVSVELMGKNAEEIRCMLNIPKLTTEEEARARRDYQWIFED